MNASTVMDVVRRAVGAVLVLGVVGTASAAGAQPTGAAVSRLAYSRR